MKKKKNFIFLSNANGGIASFQSNLINFLSKEKIYSTLLDKKSNETKKNFRNGYFKYFYNCDILKDIIKVYKILKKIKKKNYSKENIFIISNTTVFSLYFLIIKFLFRKSKIIVVYHSHIYNFNFTQIFSGLISSIFSIFIFKNIFVSDFTKKWWNLYFPLIRFSNQLKMYNYIDPPKSISKKLLTRLNVGFVGRFEIEKGLSKFMDILSKINDKKIFFSIFGEGSIKIKELKDKNINVYKWSKKKFIYSKIDILFVTSKIENCPFNVLEAKSYGIPTVTTSKGGIKEIISNNKDGFIINNYNSEKIIINKFYHIWKNYNYFKINALNNSKNYSLDNYHKFLRLF